jgi:class 3 adenylate cyclase
VEPPAVEYARSGDVSIAYHVLGEGPIDLVFTTLFISTVFSAEHEPFATFYRRLASFSRLILFDKRGTGASDRPRTAPTLEAQMDDVRAVLDAVGSQQAALFGAGHGGLMCALFAATYPERTSALILYNGWMRFPGTTDEQHALIRRFRDEWGRKETIEHVIRQQYPSLAGDREFFKAAAMVVRATASPGSAAEYMRTVTEADIGAVLPTIRAPTLLLYRKDVPGGLVADYPAGRGSAERAQEMAAAMPSARVVAVPGQDISPFVGDEIATEVEQFLRAPVAEPIPDRVLATVLFTDVVGSTARAAAVGDRAWRDQLASHRADLRRLLARYRGEELDTAGDGIYASFDGPARGIACAQAMIAAASDDGLSIRAGLHTGECERDGNKLAGIAVHVGARIAAVAQSDELLVSRTVKDLVAGSGIAFQDRGEHTLKGVPGAWQLYAVCLEGSSPGREG